MKRIVLTLMIILCTVVSSFAQEKAPRGERKRFSPQEFEAQQRAFITEHAKLTPQEAEAFFPLFFELQKKKWEINKEARNKVDLKRGEQPSEEKCQLMINEFADAKIKIAQLEKEYIALYLKAIPARKVMQVQRAEERFQREMLKKMWDGKSSRKKNNHKRD